MKFFSKLLAPFLLVTGSLAAPTSPEVGENALSARSSNQFTGGQVFWYHDEPQRMVRVLYIVGITTTEAVLEIGLSHYTQAYLRFVQEAIAGQNIPMIQRYSAIWPGANIGGTTYVAGLIEVCTVIFFVVKRL